VDATAGTTFSVNPSSVTLGAGESRTVRVNVRADRGTDAGDHQAWLTVWVGAT
jgi:uncharacterized membrane protein